MESDLILSYGLFFVILVITLWIILSLVLTNYSVNLRNDDNSINWLDTLWLSTLVILFFLFIYLILNIFIILFLMLYKK